MKRLVFVHIRDKGNIGDMACCPRDYYAEFERFNVYDFREVPSEYLRPDTLMVIGGGGMMHPGVDLWIERRIAAQPVVTWGIGHNYHFDQDPRIPVPTLGETERRLQGSLASMRDIGVKSVDWVPCVSCLSGRFSGESPTEGHGILYYEHYNYPIPAPQGYVHINNRRTGVGETGFVWDFPQVMWNLLHHRVIVTNSFHGLYWSMLLDRPVVVYSPQSTRLLGYGEAPLVRYASTPDEAFKQASQLQETPAFKAGAFLETCRHANYMFFQKVLRRIEEFSGTPLDKLDP